MSTLRGAAQARKIKKLFTDKGTDKSVKRIRTLLAVEENGEQEVRTFYQENEQPIFSLIVERFHEFELNESLRKGKQNAADYASMLQALQTFVEHCLSNQVKYADEIEKILRRSLSYRNKHGIRYLAYQILLNTLEILHSNPTHKGLLPLLQDSINIQPFIGSTELAPETSAGTTSSLLDGLPFVPSNSEPTVDESVELWRLFLEQISTIDVDRLRFWFDLLKGIYLPVFADNIMRKMDVAAALPMRKVKRFRRCPPELCEALAGGLSKCLRTAEDHGTMYDVLCEKDNLRLLMLLCREMCHLPIQYTLTTSRVIERFREFFFEHVEHSKSLQNCIPDLPGKYQDYIQAILGVFYTECNDDMAPVHESMCIKVLMICYEATQTRIGQQSQDLWRVVQESLLNTTCEVLGTPRTTAGQHLPSNIIGEMFRFLSIVWLRSPFTTTEMWATFTQRIAPLGGIKTVLEQWRAKMLQLTQIYKRVYYDPLIEEHQPRKNFFPGRTQTQTERGTTEIPEDPFICSIPWDKEEITHHWHVWRRLFGNMNAIMLPENYITVLSCCSGVIDLILEADHQLPLDRPVLLPVCQIYLPELLQACQVEPQRNGGRLIAYATLCKIFCRLESPSVLSRGLFIHFYRVVVHGLSSDNASVIWIIVRHASAIFALDLPSADVLIPLFVREVARLLRPEVRHAVPADVQSRAMKILASLISFPSQFPTLNWERPFSVSQQDCIQSVQELRNQIMPIFLQMIEGGVRDVDNRLFAIFSIGVIVCQELCQSDTRTERVREGVGRLLTQCMDEVDTIAMGALETIGSLVEFFPEMEQHQLVKVVLHYLCMNIQTLAPSHPPRTTLLVAHLNCLLSWVLDKHATLDNESLNHVFQSLEFLITANNLKLNQLDFFTLLTEESPSAVEEPEEEPQAARRTSFFERVTTRNNRRQTIFSGAIGTRDRSASHVRVEAEELPKPEAVVNKASPELIRTVHYFLSAFYAHYHRFPLPTGATVGEPVDAESMDEEAIYFVYNMQTIYCLEQVSSPSSPSEPLLRITLRNCSGKYSWDCRLVVPPEERESVRVEYPTTSSATVSTADHPAFPSSVPSEPQEQLVPYVRMEGEAPFFDEDLDQSQVDLAQEMLLYQQERKQPTTTRRNDKHVDRYISLMNEQAKSEGDYLQHHTVERTPLPLQPIPQQPQSTLHLPRLFLSHTGLLTEARKGRVQFLTLSLRLKRALKELDKSTGREMIKMGLIYVRPGQEQQQSIFANDSGSKAYLEFGKELGWSVDLASHGRYRGGLDPRSTGASALYYDNALHEVIFHEVVRMPTLEDPQQIHKKRHVGNDSVHVIYTEHKRDYDPKTITSHFNHAHIVVYPLRNGLFRIMTHKKQQLRTYGPLASGMVVARPILARLVRTTALNANTASRQTMELYQPPLPYRQHLVREICTRYEMGKAFPDVLEELLVPPKERKEVSNEQQDL